MTSTDKAIARSIIRALCISTYAARNPEWGNWYPHNKRLAWAHNIIRQVAEQPMDAIDGEETNA